METILIVIHLMIVIALVAVVMLQRSEGGALGIGGGGGFMTGRGQANALTRATAWLGAAFFFTSIVLTVLANLQRAPKSVFDQVQPQTQQSTPGQAPAGGSLFDQLQRQEQGAPAAPAVPAPGAPPQPR
ncbi:MAG: preprotein translocase subunit SecG [Beijerinckiaceae bacterium]|nr:preprotein translocase subunit SecG [Beijerinckiaceae bacterium]